MLQFYLDLGNYEVTFRLQKNKVDWEEISGPDLDKNDFLTSDTYEVIQLQEIDAKITIDGKEWKLNHSSGLLGDAERLDYHVYVHRSLFPLTPSKDQLVSIILQGDDRINNSLILNVYGFYELRPSDTINLLIDDPSIVVRYETFVAGNEYVGKNAAMDTVFIDQLYASTLEFWLIHLQTGKTNYYSAEESHSSSEEIVNQIQEQKIIFEKKHLKDSR